MSPAASSSANPFPDEHVSSSAVPGRYRQGHPHSASEGTKLREDELPVQEASVIR